MDTTTTTFTFRLEPDLKAAFERAAKLNDQLPSQLLRAYMRDYVRKNAGAAQRDLLREAAPATQS